MVFKRRVEATMGKALAMGVAPAAIGGVLIDEVWWLGLGLIVAPVLLVLRKAIKAPKTTKGDW